MEKRGEDQVGRKFVDTEGHRRTQKDTKKESLESLLRVGGPAVSPVGCKETRESTAGLSVTQLRGLHHETAVRDRETLHS